MKRYGSVLTKEFKDVRAAYATQAGAAELARQGQRSLLTSPLITLLSALET
jgi:hypothetical protein